MEVMEDAKEQVMEDAFERDLFNWIEWDQHDTMCFSFTEVVLNRDIGEFSKGMKFSEAVLSYDKGILELYNYDHKLVGKFNISLSVGSENLAT